MIGRKNEVPALTGDSSLTFVFPKSVAVQLGVRNREFLKYRVDGNQLILEKKDCSALTGQTSVSEGDYSLGQ
jgi:hypothetical protein